MPFKKGQSGNPKGRPVGNPIFRDRCKDFMDTEGWGHLAGIAQRPNRDQIAALTLIASYAYGKPTQPVSGEDGKAITIRIIDDDDSAEEAA